MKKIIKYTKKVLQFVYKPFYSYICNRIEKRKSW